MCEEIQRLRSDMARVADVTVLSDEVERLNEDVARLKHGEASCGAAREPIRAHHIHIRCENGKNLVDGTQS